MTIPQDRELIQESLKKVSEGPQALMQWAKEHADQIDQKFINQLHRMIEYCGKNNQLQLAKTFTFLEQCFTKMFDMTASPIALAITKENFPEHFHKASELLRQNKTQEAINLFQVLSLFLAQSPQQNATTLVTANLGIAYTQLKQYEKAIEYLQSALSAQDLPDTAKDKVLSNLGTLERDRNNFDLAITYYRQALELAQNRKDQAMIFIHLNNLALVHLDKKDLPHCLACQENAYQIAKQLQKLVWQQDCIARLAVIYAMQGDTKRCQELCREGLQISTKPIQKKP